MYSAPKANSQAGRILELLQSAHACGNPLNCSKAYCGRVTLPEILSLKIAQYNARIHDLRHRCGLVIENGTEPGKPDHTWFRLAGRTFPSPEVLEDREIQAVMRAAVEIPDGHKARVAVSPLPPSGSATELLFPISSETWCDPEEGWR
jgi:hypothetical protein